MASESIKEEVRQFIFEHIDSVEQLEVLLLLRKAPERRFSAKEISDEMRTTPDSAALRLGMLLRDGIILRDENNLYHYDLQGRPADRTIQLLEEEYRIRPYRIFELIFSPMKKARGFAEAFVVNRKRNEDSDG